MASPEYTLARQTAFRANEIETSSCVGEGACCESTVPLTRGDLGIIISDIRRGKISSKIINEAISRSQDPQRSGRCPFLNPENRCDIYESRPLTCMVWGIGGDPLDPENYADAVRNYKNGGLNRYPNLLLEQNTCISCRMQTAFGSTSIEANELALKACRAIVPLRKKGQDYTILKFVRDGISEIK